MTCSLIHFFFKNWDRDELQERTKLQEVKHEDKQEVTLSKEEIAVPTKKLFDVFKKREAKQGAQIAEQEVIANLRKSFWPDVAKKFLLRTIEGSLQHDGREVKIRWDIVASFFPTKTLVQLRSYFYSNISPEFFELRRRINGCKKDEQ